MPTTVDPDATQEAIGQITDTMKSFSWEKLAFLVVLFVACIVTIKIIVRLTDSAMDRAKLDRSVHTFLLSGLKVMLWLSAICVLLGYLGVPMTSLVALLSVLGLAISLAIQGSLSNLAGGIMILTAHPFSAGDFVDAGGVSGTVTEVGLVYTQLHTVDNKVIFVPNGDIASKTLVNYTAADKRQVELLFELSYNAPTKKVKECLAKVIGEHPLTLPSPEPLIRVKSYKESSIEYIMRAWCATGDYWTVYYDLVEQAKVEFDAAGLEMTYNHLNVHMIEK